MRDNGFIPAGTYPVGADIWGMPAVGAANVDDLVAVQSTSPPVYKLVSPSSLSAGVSGPESSTDNALARWDGTDGGTLKDSDVTWDGSNFRLADSMFKPISEGTLGIYESDGTTLGTLQAATVDNPSAPLTLGNASQSVNVAGNFSVAAGKSLTFSGTTEVQLEGTSRFKVSDLGSFLIIDFGLGSYTNHTTRLRFHGGYGYLEFAQGASPLQIRGSSGQMRSECDAGMAFRNYANTADAPITAGAATFSSNVSMGGTHTATSIADVDDDRLRVRQTLTPASASAAGNQGDIAWDTDYLYCCTDTNTWKRVAIATW